MTKKNITLVHCPRWDIRCPPYPTALLSGNLKQNGYNVQAKDFDIEFFHCLSNEEKAYWYNYNNWTQWSETGDQEEFASLLDRYSTTINTFVEEIIDFCPDVVGFTIRPGSFLFSKHIAKKIKQKNKHIFIIFGVPRKDPRALEEIPIIDALSYGEADSSFPRFLHSYYTNNKKPLPTPGFAIREKDGAVVKLPPEKNRPSDLDNIPFADFSSFDFTKYNQPNLLPMTFSRGCINKCSFCSAYGQSFFYHNNSPDNVCDQINHYLHNNNVQQPCHIYVLDNLINGNLNALESVATQISQLPEKLTWEGMFCLRTTMTDEYLAMLAKKGLTSVFVGLESASPSVLKIMRKRTEIHEAERIIKTLWKHGVLVYVSIVVGHPGETDSEFEKTFLFLQRMKKYMGGCYTFPLWLGDEHSDIYLHPEKYGVTLSDPLEWIADDGENTYDIRQARTEKLRQIFNDVNWKKQRKNIQHNKEQFLNNQQEKDSLLSRMKRYFNKHFFCSDN